METLDKRLTTQLPQSEFFEESYRLPVRTECTDSKKELPRQGYFTLLKMSTYDCELKVE